MQGIYVEILIRAGMDEVWRRTQQPELHQQWDLRFSRIEYLPRLDPSAPQRFLYATRIGGGLDIVGEGESTTRIDGATGERTSSLQFWSDLPYSLIQRGSGYWRYVPAPDGVTFLTWYDYETRFGAIGRLVDRAAFRPVLGWATAWSFDRLRIWIERGQSPAETLRQAFTHTVSRLTLAAIFLYHGLVPKLLTHDAVETALVADVGVPTDRLGQAVNVAGAAELLLAVLLLLFWRSPWPLVIVFAMMITATAGVAIASPQYLTGAFNPVTLNLAVAALALVDRANLEALPSARRCRRSPKNES